MDIYAKLKEIIAQQIRRKDFDLDSVTNETPLSELGLDSLDLAEVVLAIEDEFNLGEIDLEEMKDFKTVGDFVKLIEEKTKK